MTIKYIKMNAKHLAHEHYLTFGFMAVLKIQPEVHSAFLSIRDNPKDKRLWCVFSFFRFLSVH